MLPTGREFTELIEPHGVTDFLEHHWHGRSLFIPGPADKFNHFELSLDSLELILRERMPTGRLQVRYVGPEANAGPDTKLKDAPVALDQYSIASGDLTVCIDWISDRLEALGAFCSGVKAALSIPGSVFMTCYAAPDGHGFGTHFDCHPSFILQVAGSKRWRFSAKPAVEWPPANLSNAAILPEMMERYGWLEAFQFPEGKDEEGFLEQILSPGDVLFLPAGTWHSARAIGCSVALTMTCIPRTAADFFDDVVRGNLSRHVEWRQNVPVVTASSSLPDRFSPKADEFFKHRLLEFKECVASLTVDDVYESWTDHVHSFDTPFPMEVSDQSSTLERPTHCP